MDDDAVPQADIATVPPTFDESVVLLDVREDDEWQRGHAPGAQHIPMGQIPARIGEIDPAAALYRGVPGRRPIAAGLAVSGPRTATRRSMSAAECWPGPVPGRPVVTDDGGAGVI